MITSFIPLPNFYSPRPGLATPTAIYGYTEANTGDNEVYAPLDIQVSLNRNLFVNKPLWKYKLRMLVTDRNNKAISHPYYIVIVSNDEIDTNTLAYRGHAPSGSQFILPLYAHGYGRTFMFVDAVNELINYLNNGLTATNSVMSVTQYIETVATHMGYEGKYPDYSDITDVCMHDALIAILSSITYEWHSADPVHGYLDKYGFGRHNIPDEVRMIGMFRQAGQLIAFLNPYLRDIDEVKQSVVQTMPSWPSVQQELVSKNLLPDRSTDVLVPPDLEEQSRMGKFLNSLFSYQLEDFWFDVNVDVRAVHDKYFKHINTQSGFTESRALVKSNVADDLSLSLTQAVDLLGRYPHHSMIAHRSCMEDVCIYNKLDNTLLLYIDLPMWLVACCSGLINTKNTAYF